jgi:hypothetical protein
VDAWFDPRSESARQVYVCGTTRLSLLQWPASASQGDAESYVADFTAETLELRDGVAYYLQLAGADSPRLVVWDEHGMTLVVMATQVDDQGGECHLSGAALLELASEVALNCIGLTQLRTTAGAPREAPLRSTPVTCATPNPE